MKKETAKERYVRLLVPLAEADKPKFTEGGDFTAADLMALDELLREGLICGARRGDEKNRPTDFYDVRITVQGRLFLENTQKEQEAKTSVGFLKQNRWALYKWIFTVAGSIAAGFYLRWAIEWMWPTAR